MKITDSPEASALLQKAQALAASDLGPVPATRDNLDLLATLIHRHVLLQATFGQWAAFGVHDARDLVPLKVTVDLNPGLLGAPLIVSWDFTQTALSLLVVDGRHL